jgi:hypothetical protein
MLVLRNEEALGVKKYIGVFFVFFSLYTFSFAETPTLDIGLGAGIFSLASPELINQTNAYGSISIKQPICEPYVYADLNCDVGVFLGYSDSAQKSWTGYNIIPSLRIGS